MRLFRRQSDTARSTPVSRPPSSAEYTLISHIDLLDRIRAEWDTLHATLPPPAPLRSFDYVRLWYESFAAPDEVRVFRIVAAGRVLGFMPMVIRREHGARLLSGITNDHCLHSEPLTAPGCESAFAEHLVNALVDHASEWDVLDHRFTYSFDRDHPLFDEALMHTKGVPCAQREEPTYVTDLRVTFDHFFTKVLSRETRKKFRRSGEKLKSMGEASYLHLRDVDAVAAWDVLIRIEDSGWKGKNGTSIARSGERFTRFYESFIRLLSEHRALHLFQLCVDGRPIAASFGYVSGTVLHYLKAAYDEDFRDAAPSNNLLLEVLTDLMENHPEIVLFHQFPWDLGYKHRFASTEARTYETIAFSPTIRGRAIRGLFGIKERLKEVPAIHNAVMRMRRH